MFIKEKVACLQPRVINDAVVTGLLTLAPGSEGRRVNSSDNPGYTVRPGPAQPGLGRNPFPARQSGPCSGS